MKAKKKNQNPATTGVTQIFADGPRRTLLELYSLDQLLQVCARLQLDANGFSREQLVEILVQRRDLIRFRISPYFVATDVPPVIEREGITP